ncbi:CdaR family transcriptional regulator [Mycobacterium sp. 1245111.1]|uniref:PucR family transcriptional regulator n=1 Tax=Mycobacterium sp. 1245111.1 TaxID=1834073 RepID=UPI001E2E4CD0|nr:helix-turn-helix domain-containing protein [Mycobacterium sp. 1245111.1]
MPRTAFHVRKGLNVQGGQWARPSEAVRELIRRGAEMALDGSVPWLEEMQEVPLASRYARRVADDPVIVSAIRRSTRESCLRWLAENISHPGEPISTNITEAELVAVRNVVSRGLDEVAVMDAYRLAQNAALRYWTPLAFRLTSDPDDLRELLDVCQRSIASFIEAVVVDLCQLVRTERAHLQRGTDPAIHEVVAQIIEGGPPPPNIEERLGYTFRQHHTATVVWNERPDVDGGDLDRVARALTDTATGGHSLRMRADANTRWLWLAGQNSPDLTCVATILDRLPGTRIAVGPTSAGAEGFRRSHLDALTAQRMSAQVGSPCRIVRFTDIELVALLVADSEQADRFITRTLGNLASADAELRRTVLTFIHERYSASRTAARLFIHRNTLHARLAQADELLPQPLEDSHVRVAVALELLAWRRRGPSQNGIVP